MYHRRTRGGLPILPVERTKNLEVVRTGEGRFERLCAARSGVTSGTKDLKSIIRTNWSLQCCPRLTVVRRNGASGNREGLIRSLKIVKAARVPSGKARHSRTRH